MLTPRSRFPLGHAENGPCLGPAAVEGGVGHNLGNLVLGDAVLLCTHQMIAEALIGQTLRHQRHHRDKGTVPQRELVLTAPHLTKQHIIVQFCELRGKLAQGIAACSLLDSHMYRSFTALRIPHR